MQSSKIDFISKYNNLVQIAHNCRIGRSTVIAGLTGLSGSVEVGDGVRLGGQVGVTEHTRIGHGASVGAKSGVGREIADGETWLGYPAFQGAETLRIWAALRKLPGLVKQRSDAGSREEA